MFARKWIDVHLPRVSRLYRKVRDEIYYDRFKDLHAGGLHLSALGEVAQAITEGEEIEQLRLCLSNADVFVDVGAHVGVMSCVAAQMGRYVIAIEPHPRNLKILLQNLERNGFTRDIEVYAQALGDRPGLASLWGGQQGASLRTGWGGMISTYRTLVPVNTLDNILGGHIEKSERLHIKVDVEGNEHALLLGATATLSRSPAPAWTVEVSLTENFGGKVNPHYKDTFEMFRSYGYIAYPLTQERRVITQTEVDEWISQRKTDHKDINYLFVHRTSPQVRV